MITFSKKGCIGLALAISTSIVSFQSLAMDEDKSKHLAVSSGLGFAASGLFDSHEAAMGACVGVGFAKELADEFSYSGFSPEDLAMDALGCALGVVVSEYTGFRVGIKKVRDAHMLTFNIDY